MLIILILGSRQRGGGEQWKQRRVEETEGRNLRGNEQRRHENKRKKMKGNMSEKEVRGEDQQQ